MLICSIVQMFKCSNIQTSNVIYHMSNVNKIKLLSECTSGVPPVIFFQIALDQRHPYQYGLASLQIRTWLIVHPYQWVSKRSHFQLPIISPQRRPWLARLVEQGGKRARRSSKKLRWSNWRCSVRTQSKQLTSFRRHSFTTGQNIFYFFGGILGLEFYSLLATCRSDCVCQLH